jgi:hypothetical protein
LSRLCGQNANDDTSSIFSGNRIFSSVSHGERPHYRRSR